jgi:colicin import membrane protein
MKFDNRGLIGTILFHSFLLLIFIVFGFTTPLPLPGEQGILVNFGDEETGFGNEEPVLSDSKTNPLNRETKEESADKPIPDESYMTQEHEDAPAVKKVDKPKDKKVEKKPEKKAEPVTENPKTETKKDNKKTEEPVIDPRTKYTGKKTNTGYTGSEGVAGGEGNQGSPDGSTETNYHGPGGGSGDSPGFYLNGRNAISLPIPKLDAQKEGKVVVEIKVDRNGTVVNAIPGVKGSTTVDSYLLNISKTAALSSRFDSKPDAADLQTGTIEYTYRLR